jgi:hypothetical protein
MIEQWRGPKEMAAYRDLHQRALAIGAGVVYQSKPAGWLTKAMRAAMTAPVIVNVKGVAPDDAPCIVTLAQLERLQAAGAQLDNLAVDGASKEA